MTLRIAVLGAGPAGYVAALEASDLGAEVTLMGADDLGGTCLHRGCIPTKTLIASSKVLTQARRAAEFGLRLDGTIEADWPALRERMAKVVGINRRGIEELLRDRGVRTIPGRGRLCGSGVLCEDGALVEADRTVICTGSRPAIPPMFALDGHRICCSDDVLAWESLPGSAAIVGGGVIACEFAFVLRALGVDVTVVEMAPRPLPGEDPEVSAVLAREMKKRRIRFVGGRAVAGIDEGDSAVTLRLDDGDTVSAERVVVAVGRAPNTRGLGAEEHGISTGVRGEIEVDCFMGTSNPQVYAVGDVTGQLMLAHAASAQARTAVRHMLGVAVTPYVNEHVPRVTFTDPEVASVGMAESAARERFGDARVGRFDFRALGKAHALGELAGFVKLVAHPGSGALLGAHMIGPHCAEMIHEIAVLLSRGEHVSAIAEAVHAHPTLSEAVQEAAEDAAGRALHKPLTRKEPPNERARRIPV